MPPQFRRAPAQVVVPLDEIIEFDSHGLSSSGCRRTAQKVRLKPDATSV
jgi:hypothetical protein